MNELNLPSGLNQKIVNGILTGYKDYLAVRIHAHKSLRVSSAYAWVKGNHIDSKVADACESFPNLQSSIELAGYAWEYIQFTLTKSSEKYMIIIKDNLATQKTFDGKPELSNTNNYLYQLAGANNNLNIPNYKTQKQVQLELLGYPDLEHLSAISTGLSRFYVVTYEVDNLSKMIKSINLTLPKQRTMNLVQVADLTPLIENSNITITPEELSSVQNDQIPSGEYAPVQSFGYSVPEKQNEQNNTN